MNRIEWLKNISPREFAVLGMNDLAYVKRVVVNDEPRFAIHSADGTQLALLPNEDIAYATVRQNDLEPMSVH
ncbi:MAG TPA: DUF1150 family protein, partial [Stellaceae bacterium]|jgi:hypothetical protein|nr:DUF1150 family protein [Stellaceae bacterium]